MNDETQQTLSKAAWDLSSELGHGGSRQANKNAAQLHQQAAQSALASGNANLYASHSGQAKHHNHRAVRGLG